MREQILVDTLALTRQMSVQLASKLTSSSFVFGIHLFWSQTSFTGLTGSKYTCPHTSTSTLASPKTSGKSSFLFCLHGFSSSAPTVQRHWGSDWYHHFAYNHGAYFYFWCIISCREQPQRVNDIQCLQLTTGDVMSATYKSHLSQLGGEQLKQLPVKANDPPIDTQ